MVLIWLSIRLFKSYINVKFHFSLAYLKNKEDICNVSETWQWMIYDYIFLDYKSFLII
uniref:Uncharacterized protein n=1 Tax=Myoviridae sp. ctsK93 TaxID=2825190 RepID=A0A8S5PJ71_9CAUD|nr:MAG TPA: hypothetical protein [Myoviridae sp. ctsK93]